MARLTALLTASILALALLTPTALAAGADGDRGRLKGNATFLCSIAAAPRDSSVVRGLARADVLLAVAAEATSASDLRIALGRLLGEHAYLTMEAMRAAAVDRADAAAVVGGLDANTDDLTAAIAGVYGEDAGRRFETLWQQHIDALIDWAEASAAHQQSDVAAADAAMASYRMAFSEFLAAANPHLSADAEAHALQLHLDQLTSFIGMDYDQVFATERAAYSHMFEFGDTLAEGIAAQFPDRFAGARVAFSPRTTLRLDLGRLLGEHLVLSAEAMRAGFEGRPDSDAAAASLEANGADLAALIGRVYGAAGQSGFADVWGRHIDAYLRYIDAVRNDDAARRTAALADLRGYHSSLAEFLHGAIPALSVADLESLISHHVTALINQVDAAAAGDYDRSVAVTREAYSHMFLVGDALGTAIADQFPDRFADLMEIPKTSAVETDDALVPARVAIPVVAFWVVLLLIMLRSRRSARA